MSKVGNMYDFPFKVGIKCRLIIDKLEFVSMPVKAASACNTWYALSDNPQAYRSLSHNHSF